MTREERFEAIALLSTDRLVEMADRVLESIDLDVTHGPTVGLLMVRHEEPVERLTFNLIEVTVTEAEVLADGERGYAMVMGRNPEHALAGAILDVAIELDHSISSEALHELRRAQSAEEERWRQEWAEVAPTAVKFEEAL